MKKFSLLLILLTLAACSPPVDAPPPPTALITATPPPNLTPAETFTPIPALTAIPTPTATSAPPAAPAFCNDPRPRELIQSLQTAVQTKDGALLASLVPPTSGMDVTYIRNGNIVNYDVEHARFVFETTFQAEWGLGAGSGLPVKGSFQEIILPSLQQVFTPGAVLTCKELKTGGVTYVPEWTYPGMDYYSVHFPGTEQYGGLDWQTWAVGMERVDGKLYLAALVHFEWEP